MAYTPTTWVEGVTTLGPTNLNHLEGGVQTADAAATAAVPKSVVTTAGDLIYATGNAAVARLGIGSATQVLHGGASAPAWSALALADLPAGTAGQVLGGTGPSYAFPPGYVLGRTTFTSLVTVASSTEASGTTIVTAPAITADGTSSYWVEFFAPAFDITPSVAGQAVIVNVFEGATQIARVAQLTGANTALTVAPCYGRVLVTPSAASHTYVVSAYKTNAAATAEVIAGAGGTAAYANGFVQVIKA